MNCYVCDGLCELVDDREMTIVCHGCNGQGVKWENPAGPACEITDIDALQEGIIEGFDETAE